MEQLVGIGSDGAPALHVVVRAYGTQRGGLAEHIAEAIESSLRAHNAGAAGLAFDHLCLRGPACGGSLDKSDDARLSDQLYRARRVGLERMSIEIVALRALCAPVGGLDAADARTIAFYARASEERPVQLIMDVADWDLPAFVMAKPLIDVVEDGSDLDHREAEPSEASEPSECSENGDQAAVEQDELEREPEPEHVVVTATVPAPEPELDEPEPEVQRWVDCSEQVAALEAARGPQTLAAFERLFVQSYLPLAEAVDSGQADAHAALARDEFRRTFARAYADALPAFAVTGKRPRMVLDAFDVASKMTRGHRARAGQVLLVSGMRYDLGGLVAARLVELLEGRATLVDRTTLFSALPTTTSRQLESMARGVEALRSADKGERDEAHHTRTAGVVRRVRVGSRDLFKLDLVETLLDDAGPGAQAAMGSIAEQTAQVLAKHARTQPARTLLFVMGDHGHRFERGQAVHGGASPEEVIVSGHAFLMGEVH